MIIATQMAVTPQRLQFMSHVTCHMSHYKVRIKMYLLLED